MLSIWNKLKSFSLTSKDSVDENKNSDRFAVFSEAFNDFTRSVERMKNSERAYQWKYGDNIDDRYLKLRSMIDLCEYFVENDLFSCIKYCGKSMELAHILGASYDLHEIMLFIYRNYNLLINHNNQVVEHLISYLQSSDRSDFIYLLENFDRYQDPEIFRETYHRIRNKEIDLVSEKLEAGINEIMLRQEIETSLEEVQRKHIASAENNDQEAEEAAAKEINDLLDRKDLLALKSAEIAIDTHRLIDHSFESSDLYNEKRLNYSMKSDQQEDHFRLAYSFLERRDYDFAIKYSQDSLVIATELRNQIKKDRSLKQLASIYIANAKNILIRSITIYMNSLLDLLYQAKKCLNTIEIIQEHDIEILDYYEQLGVINNQIGMNKVALYWFQKEIRLSANHGNISYKIRGLRRIGELYKKLEQFDDAMCVFMDAKSLSQESGAELDEAYINLDIASVYSENGDHETAINTAYTAKDIFENSNNLSGLVICYNTISNLYSAANSIDEAVAYAKLHKNTDIEENFVTQYLIANVNIAKAFIRLKMTKTQMLI